MPLLCIFPLRNNDLWWHLASGRAMVEQLGFLHGDPFSFTGFMGDWVDNAWLSQLWFYVTWRLGGNLGLVVFRACLYTGIFLVMRSLLRAGRRPAAFFPCLVIGIALSYGWWELRPSTFSMLGTLLLLWLLEHVRRSGQGFVAFPFLFLVWASLHPGFLFGLCVLTGTVAALYLEAFIPQWPRFTTDDTTRNKLAAWTGASIVATLFNPYGWRVYSEQFSITHNVAFRAVLDEWTPPSVAFLVLLILTVGAFAVARARRVPLAAWVPIFGAAALATTGVRFAEYFALAAVPMIFIHLGPSRGMFLRRAFVPALCALSIMVGLQSPLSVTIREGQPGMERTDPVEQRLEGRIQRNAVLIGAVMAAGLIAAAFHGPWRGRWLLKRSRSRARTAVLVAALLFTVFLAWSAPRAGWMLDGYVEPDRYPEHCLSSLAGANRHVFNRLSWGGWLIWKLNQKTFIDGRGWGQPLFLDYLACYGPGRREIFDKHQIDAVIVPRGDAIATELAREPDWELSCTDAVAVVYARR